MRKLLVLFVFATALMHAQRRVAILMDTQSNELAKMQMGNTFKSTGNPAAILADYLAVSLTGKNGWQIVERADLEKILGEQNLAFGDRIDDKTACRIGQLVGANSIVIGKVTNFGVEEDQTTVLFVNKYKTTVSVNVTAKLMNVQTGSSPSFQAEGTQMASGGFSIKLSPTSSIEKKRQLTQGAAIKAMQQAAKALADQLVQKAPSIVSELRTVPKPLVVEKPLPPAPPTAKPVYAVVVASVKNGQVYLTGGSSAGLKMGDRMALKRPGPPIMDPVTKQVIGYELSDVEVVTVNQVMDQMAIASVASGTSKAVVNDVALPAPAVVAAAPAEPAPAAPKPPVRSAAGPKPPVARRNVVVN